MAKTNPYTKEWLSNWEQRKKRAESNLVEPPVKKAPPVVRKGRKPHEQVQKEIYADAMYLTQTLNIAPMSVNVAWKGRRFKTDEYKAYEKEVLLALKNGKVFGNRLRLYLEFGFSNKASDCSNPLKSFEDVLCKKYDFDDRDIYEIEIKKIIVPKGREYIKFAISNL